MRKSILLSGILGLAIATNANAVPWESTRTTIQDLGNLCRGDRQLDQVRTQFNGRAYNGSIQLEKVFKTTGCEMGDRIEGEFDVYGVGQARCTGTVAIEFVDEFTANLEWKIINAANQNCPARHNFWQTQVRRSGAPSANATNASFTTAVVGNSPAGIYTAPNGSLMCAIAPGSSIAILSQPTNGWYRIEACGSTGYVRDEALIFF